MDEIEFIDTDEVWRILGRSGRYQVMQLIIILIGGIPMSFSILSVVFIGRDVPHVCRGADVNYNDNDTSYILNSCSITSRYNSTDTQHVTNIPCTTGYNYSQSTDSSFVAEWDLVCESETLVSLSQTLVMAGMMVGASLLPQLGDRFGRKTLHVGCHVVMFVAGVVMAFNPNFMVFLFLRFVLGMCQQGFLIPLCIMMIELFLASQRELIGMLSSVLWSVSLMALTLISFIARNFSWRTLQLILGACSVFSIAEIWLLDESLRWLMINKKANRVVRLVKKAAKINQKDFTKVWQTMRDKSEHKRRIYQAQHGLIEHVGMLDNLVREQTDVPAGQPETIVKKTKTNYGYLDLLKNSTLRPQTLILCFAWLTNSLTYYGLMLLSSKLAGNVYVNFLLGAVLEIPASVLMFILLKKIGRKKTVMFFQFLAGLFLLLSVLISSLAGESEAASTSLTVFTLAGRIVISASFNAIWIHTPELYPTNVRNVGLGLASSAARVGGMASPFFNSLARVAVWGPGAIFSGCLLIVTFLYGFLPETSGRELPHTVEELKAWRAQDREEKEKRKRERNDTKKAKEFRFEKI